MSRGRDLERLKKRAVSTADRVQLRIIKEKVDRGETLFPDEEILWERHKEAERGKTPLNYFGDAKVLLFNTEDFSKLGYSSRNALITELGEILFLAERIQGYFKSWNVKGPFDQVDKLELIENLDGTVKESSRLWAFHLANGSFTRDVVAADLVKKAIGEL